MRMLYCRHEVYYCEYMYCLYTRISKISTGEITFCGGHKQYFMKIFLNTELNKPKLLHDEMFYGLFATNKAKHILNRHFSSSCSDTIYSKIIKKIEIESFLMDYYFSISQHFSNVQA